MVVVMIWGGGEVARARIGEKYQKLIATMMIRELRTGSQRTNMVMMMSEVISQGICDS